MLHNLRLPLIALSALLVCPPALHAAKPHRGASRPIPLRSRKAAGKRAAKPPLAVKQKPVQSTVEKAALDIPDLKTIENAGSVTAALQRLPGVHSAVVDLKIHLAVVDYNPARTKVAEFLTAYRAAGFEAEEYRVESRFPKPIKLKGG